MSASVALGLGLLTGGVWGLSVALQDREALYRGKPSFYWSAQIKSQEAAARNEATQVLNQEIIPRLTKVMIEDTNDSRLRLALAEQLNNLPGIQIYTEVAVSRRIAAVGRLGDFGPAAEAAVPMLFQTLQGQDKALRGPAAISLGRLHARPDEVIPILIHYLEVEDLREDATKGLGEYGSLAKAAAPKLVALLKVPDKDLRHAIREALPQIDPTALPSGRSAEPNPAAPDAKPPSSSETGAGQKPADGTPQSRAH